MGDNVDSDLLYDDFQENDRKDFDNVRIKLKMIFRSVSTFYVWLIKAMKNL